MPSMIQAGLYSATMHYLKAIEAIGTDDAPKGDGANARDPDQ